MCLSINFSVRQDKRGELYGKRTVCRLERCSFRARYQKYTPRTQREGFIFILKVSAQVPRPGHYIYELCKRAWSWLVDTSHSWLVGFPAVVLFGSSGGTTSGTGSALDHRFHFVVLPRTQSKCVASCPYMATCFRLQSPSHFLHCWICGGGRTQLDFVLFSHAEREKPAIQGCILYNSCREGTKAGRSELCCWQSGKWFLSGGLGEEVTGEEHG